jgi:hypothetical protein
MQTKNGIKIPVGQRRKAVDRRNKVWENENDAAGPRTKSCRRVFGRNDLQRSESI